MATPIERLKVICRDCHAQLILTLRAVAVPLETPGISLYVEEEKPKGYGNAVRHGLPLDDELLAYIMYTSGSTGKPKGGVTQAFSNSQGFSFRVSFLCFLHLSCTFLLLSMARFVVYRLQVSKSAEQTCAVSWRRF